MSHSNFTASHIYEIGQLRILYPFLYYEILRITCLRVEGVYKIWYVLVCWCLHFVRCSDILSYNICKVIFISGFLQVVNGGHYLEHGMIIPF